MVWCGWRNIVNDEHVYTYVARTYQATLTSIVDFVVVRQDTHPLVNKIIKFERRRRRRLGVAFLRLRAPPHHRPPSSKKLKPREAAARARTHWRRRARRRPRRCHGRRGKWQQWRDEAAHLLVIYLRQRETKERKTAPRTYKRSLMCVCKKR